MRSPLYSGVALIAILGTAPVLAEEGMWLPNQVPALADKLKQAGLTLDPATLADLNAAPSIVKAVVGNDAARIKCASILKGPDNYKKKLLGEIAEKDFRDWIASDAARAKQYSEALESRDALIIEANDARIDNLRLATINRPQLLPAARTAYRWAKERQKPDAKRESGFHDPDRLQFEQQLTQIKRRIDPAVDRKVRPEKRNAPLKSKLTEMVLMQPMQAPPSLTPQHAWACF